MICINRLPRLGWVLMLLVVLLNFLALTAAWVDPDSPLDLPEYNEPQPIALPGMAGLFFKIVLSLGIIVLLTYWLTRFLNRQFRTAGSDLIDIVDQLPLGPNRGLYIARIAGKVVVLGVTDHQIIKIMDLDDPALLQRLKQPAADRPNPQQPAKPERFHQLIQQNLHRIRQILEEKHHG